MFEPVEFLGDHNRELPIDRQLLFQFRLDCAKGRPTKFLRKNLIVNKPFRRSLTIQQQYFVVFLRYGPVVDYSRPLMAYGAISKYTGLAPSTICGILYRHRHNGGQIVLGRSFNSGI